MIASAKLVMQAVGPTTLRLVDRIKVNAPVGIHQASAPTRKQLPQLSKPKTLLSNMTLYRGALAQQPKLCRCGHCCCTRMENDSDIETESDEHTARPGEFHGVYLLYCLNPQFKGRTYIGYTVNPARRINQHNGGVVKGGAWKTSGRGPWEMVLITHGFPNDVVALRFEWAWQHPKSTRRLSNVPVKSRNETAFAYKIRILAELLNVGPWNRLPLTIQWLKQQYQVPFPLDREPPLHMALAYGPITTTKQKKTGIKSTEERTGAIVICSFCKRVEQDGDTILKCLRKGCRLSSCITCLAKLFLEQDNSKGYIIPIKGICPSCGIEGMWLDFVKRKKINTTSNEEEVFNLDTADEIDS